jgi:hypothetical protein
LLGATKRDTERGGAPCSAAARNAGNSPAQRLFRGRPRSRFGAASGGANSGAGPVGPATPGLAPGGTHRTGPPGRLPAPPRACSLRRRSRRVLTLSPPRKKEARPRLLPRHGIRLTGSRSARKPRPIVAGLTPNSRASRDCKPWEYSFTWPRATSVQRKTRCGIIGGIRPRGSQRHPRNRVGVSVLRALRTSTCLRRSR